MRRIGNIADLLGALSDDLDTPEAEPHAGCFQPGLQCLIGPRYALMGIALNKPMELHAA